MLLKNKSRKSKSNAGFKRLKKFQNLATAYVQVVLNYLGMASGRFWNLQKALNDVKEF